MTAPDPLDYGFWLASRSFALVAFALLTAVTVLGLLSALKVAGPGTAARLRPWHERLALTGLACIALHGLLLLGDGWLNPGPIGVVVPFAMDYRPLWTGLGIIGAYVIAGVSLTFYARRRIGARRWRSLHRLAPIGFLLAAVHAAGAGSDTRSIWVLSALAGSAAAVAMLVVARLSAPPTRRPPAPRREGPPRPRAAPAPREVASAGLWRDRP
jgi:sulfoxide reductase heme-binding subunit YedZ